LEHLEASISFGKVEVGLLLTKAIQ